MHIKFILIKRKPLDGDVHYNIKEKTIDPCCKNMNQEIETNSIYLNIDKNENVFYGMLRNRSMTSNLNDKMSFCPYCGTRLTAEILERKTQIQEEYSKTEKRTRWKTTKG